MAWKLVRAEGLEPSRAFAQRIFVPALLTPPWPLCSDDSFDPSTKLSGYSYKSWLIYVFESYHIHVIASYADGNVAG